MKNFESENIYWDSMNNGKIYGIPKKIKEVMFILYGTKIYFPDEFSIIKNDCKNEKEAIQFCENYLKGNKIVY